MDSNSGVIGIAGIAGIAGVVGVTWKPGAGGHTRRKEKATHEMDMPVTDR